MQRVLDRTFLLGSGSSSIIIRLSLRLALPPALEIRYNFAPAHPPCVSFHARRAAPCSRRRLVTHTPREAHTRSVPRPPHNTRSTGRRRDRPKWPSTIITHRQAMTDRAGPSSSSPSSARALAHQQHTTHDLCRTGGAGWHATILAALRLALEVEGASQEMMDGCE